MRIELIIIGDEILTGFTQDANAQYLTRRLFGLGLGVDQVSTVGDEIEAIEHAIAGALSRADLIICTGGLGPTDDDLTRRAIARAFNAPLILEEELVDRIRARFAHRKITMPDLNVNQGLLPRGGTALENPRGTAPGIRMEQGEKLLLALPGVPVEMRSMFERTVLPLLQERWSGEPVVDRILKTTGAPESSIAERIGPLLEARDRRVRVAFLPNRAGVTLRLVFRGENRSEGQRLVGELEDAIRRELGYLVYGSGTETMEQILGYLLVLREATISVAESCTGGLIGDRITNVPGSSSYFRGGVVAYSDEIKEHVLGVPAEILEAHGAVSAQTATAMAAGVRRLMGSDLGLAVTGIAGPTGGTPEKPVGLVYVALARETGTLSEERRFSGGREEIKYRTSQWALDLVRRFLIGGIP